MRRQGPQSEELHHRMECPNRVNLSASSFHPRNLWSPIRVIRDKEKPCQRQGLPLLLSRFRLHFVGMFFMLRAHHCFWCCCRCTRLHLFLCLCFRFHGLCFWWGGGGYLGLLCCLGGSHDGEEAAEERSQKDLFHNWVFNVCTANWRWKNTCFFPLTGH